jgi:uncharacterized phage-associated protein
MRFQFNDRKTAQAAAYLVKLAGGRLNYMVLIKLLYLADREMLLKHGLPITGDKMVSMKLGPVLSQVLDFVTYGPNGGVRSCWFEYIESAGYDVTLKKVAPTEELSRFELGLLSKNFETYGKIDKWDLVRLLHETLPEWHDPGSSVALIEPADILRSESRSEQEIQQVQEDAEERWFLAALAS